MRNQLRACASRVMNIDTRIRCSRVNTLVGCSSLCLVTRSQNEMGTSYCQLDGSKLTHSAGSTCKDKGGVDIHCGVVTISRCA